LEHYFCPSVSWSKISSSLPAFRYFPSGFIFDVAGTSIFQADQRVLFNLLGFCNSKVAVKILQALSPTLNFEVGHIGSLPILGIDESDAAPLIHRLVAISRSIWNTAETSWDFTSLPLLYSDHRPPTLKASYLKLRSQWREMTLEMQRLEEENNRLFIAAYGLQDELSPAVPLNEITLTCNPHYRYGSARLKAREWEAFGQQFPATAARLAEIAAGLSPETPEATRLALEQRLLDDTMREFISYAVGCMFGRYSLDKPGLMLANQGETLDDYLRQWTVTRPRSGPSHVSCRRPIT
jgi:hypothetical protein